METGIMTGWVLVHNGFDLIYKRYNQNQTTASSHTIEIFGTEFELDERVAALGLNIEEGEG